MNVLICEDEEIMLTALEFRLRKQGFEVEIAKDGREALEKLQEKLPSLVILDLMMPYVSGMEIIKFIRNELNSSLPIVVISALEHDEVVLEAFQKGATDFVTKPFKPVELILRIKRIFQEMETGVAK